MTLLGSVLYWGHTEKTRYALTFRWADPAAQVQIRWRSTKSQALIKVITKIPMFNRVGDANATLILKACEFRTGEPGELVCTVNEPSDDFSILLSGSLGVFDRSNIQIAAIAPVAPVGEMGMFTGQPRSATVRVMEKSTLLVVKKVAFERLTRQSPQINRQVYGNVLLTDDRFGLLAHRRSSSIEPRATATSLPERRLDLRCPSFSRRR